MSTVKVIEVHESVFSSNDKTAALLREKLSEQKVFMLNVMSSPGSGKTTLLSKAINMLKDEYKIGVMDVDIESSLDAQKVADATGVPSIQIHNGGLCHIDAEMTEKAIEEFEKVLKDDTKSNSIADFDILFLENIGNLVCPAEFDTGAHKSMMILSVPEGDDKPLKYPLMFSVCDLVVISKTDTINFFDFNEKRAVENIRRLNPKADILFVSAKTGEGMNEFCEWIRANSTNPRNICKCE